MATNDSFRIGTHVIYGNNGLCRITDIKELSFPYVEKKLYYVLHPISDSNSQMFVPCDSEALVAKMRTIMSKEEIDHVLLLARGASIGWIDDKNERNAEYHRILSEGDRRNLLLLISCLYQKKQEKLGEGKRLWASDEAILHNAIKMIEEEFSFSLSLSCDEVGAYIRSMLGIQEDASSISRL